MTDRYSLYDAKANLSKIVKQVREGGHAVVITVHGEPAVEIRPYKPLPTDLAARHADMVARGIIRPAKRNPRDTVLTPGIKRPGGLKRFLDERNED
ncbi:MAG: type II toxin-antitoxin system Phd/YefM family antitoxin [bacterium]